MSYIERDAAKGRLYNLSSGASGSYLEAVEDCISILDDEPAADVSEVKHAYWYFTEYEFFSCSECGESYFNGSDSTAETRERLAEGRYYPYCPHCGAKMDAEPPKRGKR